MNHDKRLVVYFFVIVVAWMFVSTYISRLMGWNPPPKKPPAIAAAKDNPAKPDLPDAGAPPKGDAPKAEAKVAEKKQAEAKPNGQEPPNEPEVEVVAEAELVLGSTTDKSPEGYHLEAHLTQNGAGIEALFSSRFDAEFEFGKPGRRPLEFIHRDPGWPPSLALTLSTGPGDGKKLIAEPDPADADDEAAALRQAAAEAEDLLDSVLWEVVRDPVTKKIVQPAAGTDLVTKTPVTGQSIAFRTTSKSGVKITKTFRLFPNADGLEVELKFESPDRERSTVYHVLGPHGIPIEGLWYTGTFRDVFFGQLTPSGTTEIVTHAAGDVAGAKEGAIDNTTLPLRFAGIENQHFVIMIEPFPPPTRPDDRWDSKTIAILLHKKEQVQHSDVGIKITSKPITIAPDQPVVHTYQVYAGPKTSRGAFPLWRPGPRLVPEAAMDSPGSRHRPSRHHADFGLYLRGHEQGRSVFRRLEGKLRHRDHPAHDPGACAHVSARPQTGPVGPENAKRFSPISKSCKSNIRTTRKSSPRRRSPSTRGTGSTRSAAACRP